MSPWCMLFVVFLLVSNDSFAFKSPLLFRNRNGHVSTTNPRHSSKCVRFLQIDKLSYFKDNNNIPAPNLSDMKYFALTLANITDSLETAPEKALTIVSSEIKWLLSHNIPKLTEMLLVEFPSMRKDHRILKSYNFVMNFLEVFANETRNLITNNQKLLRGIIESAKISEIATEEHIKANVDKLTNSEFLVYLDSEIAGRPPNSELTNLLCTVKLRILEEHGKLLGIDVRALPILATEGDPAKLKDKVWNHLVSHTPEAVKVFVDSLVLIIDGMKTRYKNVDMQLLDNLEMILKYAQAYVASFPDNKK